MNTAYQELESRHARMSAIGGAMSIFGWDRSVMMPDGCAESRAEQISTLALIAHEMKTAPDMGDLIGEAEEQGGLEPGKQQTCARSGMAGCMPRPFLRISSKERSS